MNDATPKTTDDQYSLKIVARFFGLLKKLPVTIIFPVILTVLLFVMTIFLLILPHFETKLMDGKRELIRELTETAWSAISDFHIKEQRGLLSREHAQKMAIEHIRNLRYGHELKDYFWINDMHPILLMHPYRMDLEGNDISNFKDPNGKAIFLECVRTVRENKAGYIDYEWQWKDDPKRIVPKISFVKGFDPWGWIIGTGIYVEDVRAEIALITRKLTFTCLGILTLILGLSSYIIWQSMRTEREKKQAEESARVHREQLFQAAKLASIGTLVSGVAHEINNPLTSVMLNIPVLEKAWTRSMPILDAHCEIHGDFKINGMSYRQLRDRIPQLLTSISEGTRRVKTIVGDLKDFARESHSEMADEVCVTHVAQKAVGLVSNMIKKATDHFTENYTVNLPRIMGNSQRIEQVIINLLVNACQSLPDKTRKISIATGIDSSSEWVMIEIADEGVGIPQELIQRITDPFFTTKRDSGGTGLGLAISDRIVRNHNGTMTFYSEPGKGTHVRVSFPIKVAT